MAEIILAVILIVAGAIAAVLGLLASWANAIGGVTAPDQVNLWPVLILALLALAGVGGGAAILIL